MIIPPILSKLQIRLLDWMGKTPSGQYENQWKTGPHNSDLSSYA